MNIALSGSFLLLTFLFVACRNDSGEAINKTSQSDTEEFFTTKPENLSVLNKNQLVHEPSDFLRSHASSAINWQPWTPGILEIAERSQRLILTVIGSTHHPQSFTITRLLEKNFANEINQKYVPVLADIEVDPALGLACNHLAIEQGENIAFPFLAWLSHEGNPVAWLPINTSDEEQMRIAFRQAEKAVETVSINSPRYIIENSRFDTKGRLARIADLWDLTEEEKALRPVQNNVFLEAQNLADLYDSFNSTFDNTGGIPPGNLISSLARISQHPAASPRLARSGQSTTKEAAQYLVQSAIRDPLDDYFFFRRASRSFAVPTLSKHIKTQAEMLSSLASTTSTPSTQYALEQLITALANSPLKSQSLHRDKTVDSVYFWDIDSLAKILTPDEMKVATAAFGLRNLGNIPNGDDPRRDYFRLNTLGLKKVGLELAGAVKLPVSTTEQLLTSLLTKIAQNREQIIGEHGSRHEERAVTVSNQARLLIALAQAQTVSPQVTTAQLIEQIGAEILSDYITHDNQLLRILQDGDRRAVVAQAYDYIAVIDSLLEWYRISWNDELLPPIKALTTTYLDQFLSKDKRPIEVQPEDYPLAFPIHNPSMIFTTSTWAISYHVLSRLSQLGFAHDNLTPVLETIIPSLEIGLKRIPVIHTDYLLAACNNVEEYLLVISPNHRSNLDLRRTLARPAFDSVQTIIQNNTFPDLPSVNGKAALLLKAGKQVASYQNASQIPSALRKQLAR